MLPQPPPFSNNSSNMNSGSKETLRIRNQIKTQALNEIEFQKFQQRFQSDMKSPSFSMTSRHVSCSVHSYSANKNRIISISASKAQQEQRKYKQSLVQKVRMLPASFDAVAGEQEKPSGGQQPAANGSLSSAGTVIVPQFQIPTFPSQCSSPKVNNSYKLSQ